MKLVSAIQVMADLGFVVLVIARTSGILDFGDMSMFSCICRILEGYTIGLNVGNNTLHKFEFRNIPIVDWSVPLPHSSLCIHDS